MKTLVLVGANVVDPRDGSVVGGADVTVVDGVIVRVGGTSSHVMTDERFHCVARRTQVREAPG
ncbi:hypothetical protein [Glaciihabitans sp. dw_435]|uniref:hypothetical protein n=1 Tax=Glaciihabitans sp. dw_435 TaxID=2720081 RepID=UPI001BD45920|nr:hypothetical protein [Glaciihabitans sp. dw_435]